MPPQQDTAYAGDLTCSIAAVAPRAVWGGSPLSRAAAALTARARTGLPALAGLARSRVVPEERRVAVALPVVILMLAGMNVTLKYGPPRTGLIAGPAAAAALLGLARWSGLSWTELGLGRRSLRKGAGFAVGAIGVVGAVYVVGAVLPATRGAFLDSRYQLAPGAALVTSLIVIPLGTVLLEEIAFRGVLPGLAGRYLGTHTAAALSSVLFGLWHILPSLRLGTANRAIGSIAGGGSGSQVLVVSGAVAFTTVAGLIFCELRRRSGSVLASAGLHWATNGLGVLLAAALWRLSSG